MYRVVWLVVLILAGMDIRGESTASVDPAVCVRVRTLAPQSLVFSPDGGQVAYLVKAPNLATNENDDLLFTASVERARVEPKAPLARLVDASELTWTENGRSLAVLARWKGQPAVLLVDAHTGAIRPIVTHAGDAQEFTIDRDGRTLVVAIEVPRTDEGVQPNPAEEATGYRVPLGALRHSNERERRLFVLKRAADGAWSAPEPLEITSPVTGARLIDLPYTYSLRLSLSPDGRRLLVSYLAVEGTPSGWERSPWVKEIRDASGPLLLTVLRNLVSRTTSMPLPTPWAYSIRPLWSADSAFYFESASAPANSALETKDEREGYRGNAHLFAVDAAMGQFVLATESAGAEVLPLTWDSDRQALISLSSREVERIGRVGIGWHRMGEFELPLSRGLHGFTLAAYGSKLAGLVEGPTTPSRIEEFQFGEEKDRLIADLNPALDTRGFARAVPVHWRTSSGDPIDGLLLMPRDYNPARRYPLVIQTQPNAGRFLCDAGDLHFPSFCPQPLATAGILYLVRTMGENQSRSDDVHHYPKGYPGGVAEAAFYADMYDRAVQSLARRGIVDPNRVGIIGFSRTGWYTGFALAHGRTQYAAATMADNVEYSLSEYWLLSDAYRAAADAMYGGSPYGPARTQWLRYSISFSAARIHAPLLLETMGHGVHYASEENPPTAVSAVLDLYTALTRLKRPVEWYYYPDEEHCPDHPQARLASLTRNLDWYRFWLTGYEDPNPAKKALYERWKQLRVLDANELFETRRAKARSSGN